MNLENLLVQVVDAGADPDAPPPRIVSVQITAHTSDGGLSAFMFDELNDRGLVVDIGNSKTL